MEGKESSAQREGISYAIKKDLRRGRPFLKIV